MTALDDDKNIPPASQLTPQQAVARILEHRKYRQLPEGVTVDGLIQEVRDDRIHRLIAGGLTSLRDGKAFLSPRSTPN